MNAETAAFIKAHAYNDVRELALKKAPEGVDLKLAITQIDGRQRATKKLPSLAAIDGILYPPRISMEQCSSEQTATYKAELAQRLGGETFADLTGGFGIDFIFMSRGFKEATYVEQQEILCTTVLHNFSLLEMSNAKIVNTDGTEYLKEMPPVDTIYLDPARRDKSGARTFAIGDCTPNVLDLLPQLKSKSHHIIIKLSPMLDWRKAVSDLGKGVSEVHIVSTEGECKELLLVVGKEEVDAPTIYCVNLGAKTENFVFSEERGYSEECGVRSEELNASPINNTSKSNNSSLLTPHSSLKNHSSLYLPNPSIMKAGCFAELCERYGVQQVAANSHIFLSDKEIEDFPGKSYIIEGISTMNKRVLRQKLSGISRANIATRNFPLSPTELRKRLKLADGGDTYIFATTTADGEHILFICKKS